MEGEFTVEWFTYILDSIVHSTAPTAAVEHDPLTIASSTILVPDMYCSLKAHLDIVF